MKEHRDKTKMETNPSSLEDLKNSNENLFPDDCEQSTLHQHLFKLTKRWAESRSEYISTEIYTNYILNHS